MKLNFPDPKRALRMPYGKHKGEFLSELPLPYLEWAVGSLTGKLREDIEEELKRRSRPGAGKVIKP